VLAALLTLASLGPVVAGSARVAGRLALPAASDKGTSRLSPSLRQLVAQLGPGVRTAPREVVGMPASIMKRDVAGRVGVRITAQDPDTLLPDLRALGMTVTASLPEQHLLEGYVATSKLASLDALAAKGLFGVLPMSPSQRNVGAATSQADFTQGVERVRATVPPGLTGAGVGVGVMSDSFNRLGGAAAGVASGDLPNVTVLQEASSGGTDEGRGMAELVHDLAPGSPITFGSVDFGEAAFAQTIQNLANPAIGNCKALVDDVFYYAEPIYQDGVIAQAVDSVVTNRGATYFSSAGNQSDQACEFVNPLVGDNKYINFNTPAAVDNVQRIIIPAHGTVQLGLFWDDPFYTTNGVDTDMDLELYGYDSGSNLVRIANSSADSIVNRTPWEFLQYTNPFSSPLTCEIALLRYAGPNPGRVRWENYGSTINIVEYTGNKSGTISPHSAADGAMSVAAVNYFAQETSASFTSRGPTRILFSPNGSPLGSVVTRNKPDIAAIQGTDTTFFGQDADGNGFPNFFGTSAAAPHAAAIAALIKEQFPSMTPAEIYARMKETTGNANWNNVTGFGTVRAYEAIFGLPTPAAVALTDGFESNTLSGAYEVWSTGAGRVRVTNALTPAAGARHLVLDSSLDGVFSRNAVILHVNAAGLSNVSLSFKEKEFSDDDHPMSASFTSELSDGVALSVDGVTWYRLVSLTGAASTGTYQSNTFDLSQFAADHGLTLGGNTRILFQQYGNSTAGFNGFAFDDLSVTSSGGAALTVAAPNGGESWTAGSAQSITWTSFNLSGNVKLELSTNAGSTWTTLNASTANDGSESFTVPNTVTTQGRVRVSSATNAAINDTSDGNFSIVAPPMSITITAPNGGENWTVGNSHAITWSSLNVSGDVKLEFSTNAGSTWTTLNAGTANDGTETIIVPNAPTTQARVKVSSVTNSNVSDVSNADFTVTYSGGILKAPAKAKFGTVKIGKTKTVSVVLQNTSKTAALIVNVSSSGAPFRIVSGGGSTTIAAKKKLTLKVICEPTALAPDGTLTVTSSDPSHPSVSILLDATIK